MTHIRSQLNWRWLVVVHVHELFRKSFNNKKILLKMIFHDKFSDYLIPIAAMIHPTHPSYTYNMYKLVLSSTQCNEVVCIEWVTLIEILITNNYYTKMMNFIFQWNRRRKLKIVFFFRIIGISIFSLISTRGFLQQKENLASLAQTIYTRESWLVYFFFLLVVIVYVRNVSRRLRLHIFLCKAINDV